MSTSIKNSMTVIDTSKNIEKRVHKRLELALPIELLGGITEPKDVNSDSPCSSDQEMNNGKTILRLLEIKLIITISLDKLKKIFLAIRDWYEDRPSYYDLVDTHNYDTKIMLINRLHNR